MNNKRIIKNDLDHRKSITNKEIINIPPDNQTLHPISSQWIEL